MTVLVVDGVTVGSELDACDAELHLLDGRAELIRGYPVGLAS
jgi:hypothetical protein